MAHFIQKDKITAIYLGRLTWIRNQLNKTNENHLSFAFFKIKKYLFLQKLRPIKVVSQIRDKI